MAMRKAWIALCPLLTAACTAAPFPVRPTAEAPRTLQAQVASASTGTDPAMIELGIRLFFEAKLSANDQMSCATCHHPRKGFSNAESKAKGVNGQRGIRNTPTLYGAAQQAHQFWDGRAKTLEEQALGPVTNPVEMASRLEDVVDKLSRIPYYRQKFQQVYGQEPHAEGIAKALAAFERALKVGPTPYDRHLAGDKQALSAQQQRGLQLFNSRKTSCSHCHNGPILSNGQFLKIGVNATGSSADPGRFAVTRREQDRGAFKVPTLLNIARTAPYMHDGSLATLEAVVDFYDRGGGPAPSLHPMIRPLGLTAQEKADLVAFMHALTGPDNFEELAKLPGIRLPSESWADTHLPADRCF